MSTETETRLAPAQLAELSINTIRFLAVDAVQKANSGHPGMPMGAAPMAYVLWTRHLRFNPSNPFWFDRDRFVLSAGHGSMLLYALLHLTGYDMPMEQLQQFRRWGSHTPGHPERDVARGVETTTGPLGQGVANAVGMAVAEAHLAARFNRPGHEIIHHYTYALCSDGDLMEGVGSEAASLAGQWRLGRLIFLYDDNRITLSASTQLTFVEDRAKRFEACGWHTQVVDDGNDIEAISRAIENARSVTDRPSFIQVRTHIGYGSPHKQDSFEAHGSPLGDEEVALTKANLGWPLEPAFYVPQQALNHFREAVPRGQRLESEWRERFAAYERAFPSEAAELKDMIAGRLPEGWDRDLPVFPVDPKGISTRVAAGRAQYAIASRVPALVGGSADLDPSTFTAMKDMGDMENPALAEGDLQGSVGGGWSYAGRNVHFGVREHGMGGILNGIACHGGLIPFGATFLIFSDYMRPPIRLAALMKLGVVYVFTHDSIGLGEDGPTHQPVEQLAGLRAIPHLLVLRPADAGEAVEAWRVAMMNRDRPVALVLTRQHVPIIDRSRTAPASGASRGGYVLSEAPGGAPNVILIASGSEVQLVLGAQEKLREQNVRARIVSMPCWRLFDEQPESYRDSVLPASVKARLSVEAASPMGWCKYVGDEGDSIGVERFGASAPGGTVMREFGFTVDHVVERALALVKR